MRNALLALLGFLLLAATPAAAAPVEPRVTAVCGAPDEAIGLANALVAGELDRRVYCTPVPGAPTQSALEAQGITVEYLSDYLADWQGDAFVVARLSLPDGLALFGIVYVRIRAPDGPAI